VAWVRERTVPTDLSLSAKVVPTFADRGYCVVSVTDPYGRNLGFIDRRRYFYFQVLPQFYSRGWVDPVPDPLLLGKSSSAGNRTRTSGSVARNSDSWTTEEEKKLHSLESETELYRTSDRRLSAKLLPTFADRGCHVVIVTDPYGLILGFLDSSHYFSIK
jgi:hypothetical protein